jgi:putative copper export protein
MGTDALRAALLTAHLAAAAVWLGGMIYSLVIVQPRAQRLLGGPQPYEPFAVALAAGARRGVLALAGALAASGAGLVGTAFVLGAIADAVR